MSMLWDPIIFAYFEAGKTTTGKFTSPLVESASCSSTLSVQLVRTNTKSDLCSSCYFFRYFMSKYNFTRYPDSRCGMSNFRYPVFCIEVAHDAKSNHDKCNCKQRQSSNNDQQSDVYDEYDDDVDIANGTTGIHDRTHLR